MMVTAPMPFIVEAVPRAWSASTKGPVTGPAMLVAGRLQRRTEGEVRRQAAERVHHDDAAARPAGDRLQSRPPRVSPIRRWLSWRKRSRPRRAAGGGGRGAFGAWRGRRRSFPPCARPRCGSDSIAAAAAGRGGPGWSRIRSRRGERLPTPPRCAGWSSRASRAILLADARHTDGDIGTDNGASRVPGAPQVPFVHVAMESYGRIGRMLEKNVPVTIQLDMENRFFPAEHDVVQHHRRDSRDRSARSRIRW